VSGWDSIVPSGTAAVPRDGGADAALAGQLTRLLAQSGTDVRAATDTGRDRASTTHGDGQVRGVVTMTETHRTILPELDEQVAKAISTDVFTGMGREVPRVLDAMTSVERPTHLYQLSWGRTGSHLFALVVNGKTRPHTSGGSTALTPNGPQAGGGDAGPSEPSQTSTR